MIVLELCSLVNLTFINEIHYEFTLSTIRNYLHVLTRYVLCVQKFSTNNAKSFNQLFLILIFFRYIFLLFLILR